MSRSRLTLALESGAASLPADGRIAVFRPDPMTDLSALDQVRVQIIHGFRPTFEAWRTRGFDCATAPGGDAAAALVFLPRGRAHARMMIAQALALTGGGPVIVDGARTDGIDAMWRAARSAGLATSDAFVKAHGRLFTVNGMAPMEWEPAEIRLAEGYVTHPAAFSADGVDPASAALAAALPELSGTVADLGAGWGYLSAQVLASDKVETCHLIEAEIDALNAARTNLTDPRARFMWEDVTRIEDRQLFDHIVMNPPFHRGRQGDPDLGAEFIRAAARLLAPTGTLWMVANRHLPYESSLAAHFGQVSELAGTSGFKLFRAERPNPKARPGR